MKNNRYSILIGLLFLVVCVNSCKKDEASPVEPATHGVIRGIITDQETGSLIENVSIYSNPSTSLVTSDIGGGFQINTVLPGDYTLSAAKVGYDSMSVPLTVTEGAETIANFILEKSDSAGTRYFGHICGVVRNSANGLPIPKVNLTTDPSSQSVSTDDIGKFQILNVPAGEYIITAEKTAFDTIFHTIVIQAGITSVADFFLSEVDTSTPPTKGNIKGSIKDAFSGAGIAGTVISTTPITSVVTSNSDGTFSIDGLTPGSFKISASKSGYQNTNIDVTVTAGNNTRADIVMTTSYGSISGIVKDAATELPIQGVNIQTDPASGSVTTDSDGKFTLSIITPGSYTVKASKSGYTTAEISVVVTAGNITIADVQLGP